MVLEQTYRLHTVDIRAFIQKMIKNQRTAGAKQVKPEKDSS